MSNYHVTISDLNIGGYRRAQPKQWQKHPLHSWSFYIQRTFRYLASSSKYFFLSIKNLKPIALKVTLFAFGRHTYKPEGKVELGQNENLTCEADMPKVQLLLKPLGDQYKLRDGTLALVFQHLTIVGHNLGQGNSRQVRAVSSRVKQLVVARSGDEHLQPERTWLKYHSICCLSLKSRRNILQIHILYVSNPKKHLYLYTFLFTVCCIN